MRLRFKLREKIIFITVATLVLVVGFKGYLDSKQYLGEYEESLAKNAFLELKELRNIIIDVTELGLSLGGLSGIDRECRSIVERVPYAKYCFIMGLDRKIYYHNSIEKEGLTVVDSGVQKALDSKEGVMQRITWEDAEEVIDFALPIIDEKGVKFGVIRLGINAAVTNIEISKLISSTLVSIIITMIFTWTIIFFFARSSILKPIRILTEGAKAFGQGDLSVRIELPTGDEFDDLAQAFNIMIAELKKSVVAMRELERSRKRFDNVASGAGEWIWELDRDGRYIYSSALSERILGHKSSEVLGKFFYDFFHPDEKDSLKKEALKVFNKKMPFHGFINRNIKKDGSEVIIETSGMPVLNDNKELSGYIGSSRDITEHMILQQEIRDKMESLERFNKAAVGREIKMVELKNKIEALEEHLKSKEKT